MVNWHCVKCGRLAREFTVAELKQIQITQTGVLYLKCVKCGATWTAVEGLGFSVQRIKNEAHPQ